MKQFLLSLAISLFSLINGYSQTIVNANISANQTWTPANSPYIVSQNISVNSGVKLTILPGTRIRNAGSFLITVLGGVEAIGKFDTLIYIDTVEFKFNNGSMGYNFSTSTGSQFSYCQFKGDMSYMALYSDQTPLLISHCKFSKFQYAARQITSTSSSFVKLRFEDCFFENGVINSSVIWPFGNKTELEMERCTIVNHQGGLMMATKNRLSNCLFYNWTGTMGFDLYMAKNTELRCNVFRKFNKYILQFPIGGFYENTNFLMENNTLDSANNLIEYYVNTNMSNSGTGKWQVKNNNFLKYFNNSIYVAKSTNSGYVDTLDFSGNYWGTINTTSIAAGIFDNLDNNFISTVIDFKGSLFTAITGCPPRNSCPKADFIYALQDSTIEVTEIISSFYDFSTKWSFGDGTSLVTQKNPKHTYKTYGTYNVCIYVYDENNTLCDSFCRLIEIKEPQCKARFNFGLSTTDPDYLYVYDNSRGVWAGTSYKWEILGMSQVYNYTPSVVMPNILSSQIQLCLTISDSSCSSMFCDSISVPNNVVRRIYFFKGPDASIAKQHFNQFRVYPNPGLDFITVAGLDAYNEELEIIISDLSGRVVKSFNYNEIENSGKVLLDIQDISNGMYWMTINNNSNSETHPLSIVR